MLPDCALGAELRCADEGSPPSGSGSAAGTPVERRWLRRDLVSHGIPLRSAVHLLVGGRPVRVKQVLSLVWQAEFLGGDQRSDTTQRVSGIGAELVHKH